MIIGKGSIASMLNDREGFIFFAAGVSNSQLGCLEDRFERKERERRELFNALGQAKEFDTMIVYFGTISKFFDNSSYIDHKNKMESMIRELAVNFTILNIGNVWECTNPNTFINKMKYWERQGKLSDSVIRDEYKFMISADQLRFITGNLPSTGKHEISIFGQALKVLECLKR